MSVWIGIIIASSVCVLLLSFLFFSLSLSLFFFHAFKLLETSFTVHHYSHIFHGTYNHSIKKKYILKMEPTALFTHLKIILLQCFQFSVSAKISYIQTDPSETNYFLNKTQNIKTPTKRNKISSYRSVR